MGPGGAAHECGRDDTRLAGVRRTKPLYAHTPMRADSLPKRPGFKVGAMSGVGPHGTTTRQQVALGSSASRPSIVAASRLLASTLIPVS